MANHTARSAGLSDTNGSSAPERLVPGTLHWDRYRCEHQQRYNFFAERYAGCNVLDAACGVGYGTQMIAEAGARWAVGIDASATAVQYACAHFATPRTHFIQGDVERIPLPDQLFDIAISFETIEHLHNPAGFVRELRRVLKPGGLLVCSTPNSEFRSRYQHHNSFHCSEMSFAQFSEVIASQFTIEERYYQTHSEAYLRHLDLVSALERSMKPIRFSKMLRAERVLRGRLGREQWDDSPLSAQLSHAVPGDYLIAPLREPAPSQLTFILVARAR